MTLLEKFNFAREGGYVKKFTGHLPSKSTNHPFRYIIDDAVNWVPEQKLERVLDIGIGDGYGANLMRTRFQAETYGITITPLELKWANETYPEIKVSVMDVHDLTFQDEFFDLITLRDSFEHFLSPFLALCECFRVLKKDGLIMIALPINDIWVAYNEHLIVPNKIQMTHLLKISGFEVLKYEETIYPPEVALTQAKYLAKK